MADKEFNLIGVIKANTQEFERGMDKANNKNKKFSRDQKRTANKTKQIGNSLKSMAGSFGAVFGGAATAVATFKGVVNNSQVAGDKWTATVDGMKGGLAAFYRTLGTGDWDNLIQNMIDGKDAAVELSKAMDDLFEGGMSENIRVANINEELAELDTQLKVAKQNKDWERVITIATEIDEKSQEKLDIKLEESQRKYDALRKSVNKNLGFEGDELIKFLENYRDDENLMKEANDYLDEVKKLEKRINQDTQITSPTGISVESSGAKEDAEEAEKELEKLINSTDSGIIEMADQIEKYGGTTDEMVQKLVDAYIALTDAQTENIRYTKKSEGDKARAQRMLEKEGEEVDNTKESYKGLNDELTKMQSKGVSSVGNVNTDDIDTTTLKPTQSNTPYQNDYDYDTDRIENQLNNIEPLVNSVSTEFVNLFDNAEDGFENLEDSVVSLAKTIASQLLSKSIMLGLSLLLNPGGTAAKAVAKNGFLGELLGFSEGGITPDKFAGGGMIGGNSTIGDKVPVLANSREMILNRTQQGNLFRMLDNGNNINSSDSKVQFEIKGDKLIGVLNNYNKRTNSYR
ncbi:MAG: hypothetical protein ACOCRK_10290 [bacterium]